MKWIDAATNPPPKNGDLLLLVVRSDHSNHPTEDDEVFRTIGFNNLENTGEDMWECAGWKWCGDEFVQTTGEIIAWMEMPSLPDPANR